MVVSPTSSYYGYSVWRRFAGDVASMLSFPFRTLRLALITQKVVKDVKAEAKEKMQKGASSSPGSSKTLEAFLPTYMLSHVIHRTSPEDYRALLNQSLHILVDSITAEELYPFEPYHERVRGPGTDYYAWGNDFFRSMVKYRASRVLGKEQLARIERYVGAGDNVVFIANHQTEADPQVLSILLELEGHDEIAEQTVFVAGHKVTTDRLAVPFSMGRNLLTIFSKKYLDSGTEEEREARSARNRKTVNEMSRIFSEGGHTLWVAPSGGRDRRSPKTGRFEPAKFDAQSVGLFLVVAQKAARKGPKTHFFPLAMWTHELVPPPEDANSAVGESRSAERAPLGLYFGPELDVEKIGGRKVFPKVAETVVGELYAELDAQMRLLKR